MNVSFAHESIRLTGRWDISNPAYAETTATGSYLEFAFEGDSGHHETLEKLITDYNEKNGTDIAFIDSTGWIPLEPLHPLRDGHKTVAKHLIERLKNIL